MKNLVFPGTYEILRSLRSLRMTSKVTFAVVSSCNQKAIYGSRRLQPAPAQARRLYHRLIAKWYKRAGGRGQEGKGCALSAVSGGDTSAGVTPSSCTISQSIGGTGVSPVQAQAKACGYHIAIAKSFFAQGSLIIPPAPL